MENLNQSTLEKAMRRAFRIWLGVIPAPECLEDMQAFRIPAVDVEELRLNAANDGKTLDCPSDVCDYLAELVVTDYDWHMLPCSVRRILLDMVVWAAARPLITLRISPVSSGSSAEVGSSKNRTLGERARARAIATRCC